MFWIQLGHNVFEPPGVLLDLFLRFFCGPEKSGICS